jgi:flavin reductase (DIM6/NTAB) family NADH-FMN oxidoreductase RutF
MNAVRSDEARVAAGAVQAVGSSPVSPSLFKTGMRRLTGGVTVVSARASDGTFVGMTATSVCSLSAEPPKLLVCANSSGSFASKMQVDCRFCVNLLAAGQEDVARLCAGMSALRGHERFASPPWRVDEMGLPVLESALARFHCAITEMIPVATHLLILGHVTEVHLGMASDAALAYREGQFIAVN